MMFKLEITPNSASRSLLVNVTNPTAVVKLVKKVTGPILRIIVNNAFVLLDAQLNEIKSIIFSEINCEFLKPASQNELWFYDSLSQQVGLYNLNSKKIKFLSNPTKAIKQSQSDYNYLYWIDNDNNGYSISKFGKIANLGKVAPFEKVVFLSQNHLFYLFEHKIYYYTFENQLSTRININENLIANFFYTDGFFSIFTNNQLSTYQIKK